MTAKQRKYILRIVPVAIIAVIGMHAISALTLDRMVEYREVSFSSPRLPKAMDGYVVAFITDTHDMSPVKLAEIVARVNARDVHLLALGGDYPDDDAAATMAVLSNVKTKDGVFGVLGNHDLYQDIVHNMRKHGMTFLYNKGLELKPGFFLAGVSDLTTHKPHVGKALEGAAKNDFILLLSHNPVLALEHDVTGVDLILSGHTHGGLINFFGLWSPALAMRYPPGNKLRSGWYKADVTDILVSNGTGYTEKIPRAFARPQVIFLTLKAL